MKRRGIILRKGARNTNVRNDRKIISQGCDAKGRTSLHITETSSR
jgi:hypothetical protein